MKGVTYNLKIKKSSSEYIIYEGLAMDELCKKIKTEIKNLYDIDVKCNNQKVYNLQFRQKNVNRLLRGFVSISKKNNELEL